MTGTRWYWVFGIGLIFLLALFWWGSGFFASPLNTITDDLAAFPEVADRVAADFATYPLATLNEEYTLTDTLKDGVEITYGGASATPDLLDQSSETDPFETEPGQISASTTDATFTSPDLAESLSLSFPHNLSDPLTVTLPGDRLITVTQADATGYTSELLTGASVDIPEVVGNAEQESSLLETAAETDANSQPQYLKYTSPDSRLTTYYAYQKDQAAGYRNLKHWTIFKEGNGQETQSYLFRNAHLRTNDRGEVEVRYMAPPDESVKSEVDADLWARAQAVLAKDLEADIENRPADIIIPAPYTIDAQGSQVTHEWVVTPQSAINPDDTSGDFVLSVSFEVPLLGYPIALDPTLQFTAPGVSNAGDVLTGETTSNYFGYSLTTGDFNSDGKDDLAVGAYYYNTRQGRAYIFYGGSMVSEGAAAADVILTGETTDNYFGSSLTTGDFNSDGKDDLAVGAYRYNSYQGRAYIFYGGSIISKNASAADVVLTGEVAGYYFGLTLATGDLNADGTDDLVVGADSYNNYQGRTFIFYGGSMVSENAATADVTLTGEGTYDNFGHSLTIGDFNADGTVDVAVGAVQYNSYQGRAYIFYGGSLASKNASAADVILTGGTTQDNFGQSLTTGDLNADGKDDLVVGAGGYGSFQGRAYIFYGGSMVSEGAAAADVILTGEIYNNYFSQSLITADINSDGADDLVVSAYGHNSNRGRAYIFYGGSMVSEGAATADVILTGEATGSRFGWSLTTGDLNADGKDDLAVGARTYNASQGRAYIFYSQSGQVNLDQYITGEGTGDYFGSAFTTGDFNNDGREDLAVGAYKDNTNTGKVYIFYNDGDYTNLASTSDVVITGTSTNSDFGYALASGDLDGDGDDDLIVGAPGENSDTGYIAVFYNDGSYPATAAGADVSIVGEAAGDYLGSSLTTGDLNTDGKDDLAVGALTYNSWQGRVYIFYGGSMVSEGAASADVILTGETGDNYYFGSSLTTGDLNADGKEDLAVGAFRYNSWQGRSYIFYGGSMVSEGAIAADVILTGETDDGSFGISLTTGDLNADGKEDLVIGAYAHNTSQGRTYIFYGGSMVSEGAATADVILTGETTSNSFGYSLTTGDFNADGKTDLAVGAYSYNSNQGRAYIFYNDGSYPSSAADADVIVTGDSANDDFGYALTTGDFNNDGRDDLVVGAPGYNSGGDTGRAYFYQTREDYAWDVQRHPLSDGLRVDPIMGYEMKITGEAASGNFGQSVTTGDFNNDGKEDLAVGAYTYNSNQGKVYIFYNDGNYSTKAGRADVILTGETTGDYFGYSLTTGDLNADGTEDLAVGAYGYSTSQGRAYIFYGGSMISENASAADVILTGEATNNQFGRSLTTGDFNADGEVDLAIGARSYSSQQGRAYIFHGGSMVSEGAATADVILTGEVIAGNSAFGYSLTTGDLNADGKDDLAVGAYTYNFDQGRAYIFYGGSMISENASAADVILTGESGENFFGNSLTTGDLNADGKDDLVVGAYAYASYSYQGRAYIFYGGSMVSEGAATADVILTGEAADDGFGTSLTTGDLNADGKDDLVVGAYGPNSNQGRAYIFYGGSMVTASAATADVILTGEAINNYFGTSLTTGDLNADGGTDLIIGATGYNTNQGRVYFYTTNDRHLTGEATGNFFGNALTTGDFNADGKADLAVGAYNANQGRTYIFYGGNLDSENAAAADIILTGEVASDYFGYSLTTGDFNTDGTDDLVVSAYNYNSAQGRAYVFYGDGLTNKNASAADVILTGEATSDSFGLSLTTGDFNTDGTDDLAIGANGYSSYQGRAYIFHGGSMVSEGAATADVILTGEATSNLFGFSLTATDLNTDGTEDLIVGAQAYGSNQGRTYIFYGGSMATEGASAADIILTGATASDQFGYSFVTGDTNSDGKNDLVVGAAGYNSNQGRVYIFYGGSLTSRSALAADVIVTGEATGNVFGGVLTAGDLNADGKLDLAIGAYGHNSNQGRTYIFYNDGSYSSDAANADVIISGYSANDYFGFALTTGDFSNNGTADLVVGAAGYDNGALTGRVHIIMSEAATQHFSQYRLQGTVKMQGTVRFR